jgi:hypothetical protein
MLVFLSGVAIGIIVGWHVPEPVWAMDIYNRIKEVTLDAVNYVKGLIKK